MPDVYEKYPEQRTYDPAPRRRVVPVANILDPPYVCISINEQWVGYIAGAVDRIGWPDVWQGTETELQHAFDQINFLQEALMIGECVLPLQVPYEVVEHNVKLSSVGPGTVSATLFTVPANERWKVTGGTIMTSASGDNSVRITGTFNTIESFLLFETTPVAFRAYPITGEYWLMAGDKVTPTWVLGAAGTTVWSTVSVEKYQV